MKNKDELYTELLKKVKKIAKTTILSDKNDLLETKTKEVVENIYDPNWSGIHCCSLETLNTFREFIGVLPRTKKEISPNGMGQFKSLLSNEIVFDSILENFKEKVQLEGKPMNLDIKFDEMGLSTRTINSFYRNYKMCRLDPNIPITMTLKDFINLDLYAFEQRARGAGNFVLNQIVRILEATGYGYKINEIQFELPKDIENNLITNDINELRSLRNKYSELCARRDQLEQMEKKLDKEFELLYEKIDSLTVKEVGNSVTK